MNNNSLPRLLTATDILNTEYPDLDWVIKGLLPNGLSFLAGVPKIGKSWFALQIAKSVASGDSLLGCDVIKGKVLYLALEDSGSRLKKRMNKQGWPEGLDVEFMSLKEFSEQINDLKGNGVLNLANRIKNGQYKLVIIDTLSRATSGDQNDVGEMTTILSQIQTIAFSVNCAILFVDHHRKSRDTESPDSIRDILGSTAKGGVADTIMGIYKDRGSTKAKLSVTGRDIDETTFDIIWDKSTGCWSLPNDKPNPQMEEIIITLEESGAISNTLLAKALGRLGGTVHKQLGYLQEKGLVVQNDDKTWEISKAN